MKAIATILHNDDNLGGRRVILSVDNDGNIWAQGPEEEAYQTDITEDNIMLAWGSRAWDLQFI